MKTSATVTITRQNKRIVIYVNDGDWSKVPDLGFIADVEVSEILEVHDKKQKHRFFTWVIKKMNPQVN